MMKSSLLLMAVMTVVLAIGLSRLEARKAALKPRETLVARGKRGLNRWVNAAAIAAALTLLIMGGLHWFRVWQQG